LNSAWVRKSGVCLLASAIMAGYFAAGCADVSDGDRIAEAKVRDSMPTQVFEDVQMVQTHEGDLQFILRAPRLDRYDKLDRAIFYGGIRVQFYEKGSESSLLTAERGEVHSGGDELIALGHVVVTTDTGTTILTPRLKWLRKTGEITSDTAVTIITTYDTLYGTGLIASEDLKQRRILQPTGVTHRTLAMEDTTASGFQADTLENAESDTAAVELPEVQAADTLDKAKLRRRL